MLDPFIPIESKYFFIKITIENPDNWLKSPLKIPIISLSKPYETDNS